MKKRNILALTYWSYRDALVQTYTLPYLRMIRRIVPQGSKIHLITFENDLHTLSPEEIKRTETELSLEGIRWVRLRYFPLSPKAFANAIFALAKLLTLCLFHRVAFIHAWCTPAGAMGYLLSKITGASLIIDSYEPHAEAMVENGTWKRNSLAYRLLLRFEKWQSKQAKALIGTTEGMKEYAQHTYGYTPKKFYVKPACVNLELFSSKNKKKAELLEHMGFKDKIVCVYAGKFGGIYLSQEVFGLFKAAQEYWKDRFRVLLLSSHTSEEIDHWCRVSGTDKNIITRLFVPHHSIPDHMGLGDFGITPVKPLPSKKYCSPIKDGEYWALGLPVLITPGISDDSSIITENNAGAVISSFDHSSCLAAIKKMDAILSSKTPEELYRMIRPLAERYRSYDIAEKIYSDIYREPNA